MKGQNVLIIGASSGLGRELALQYARKQADVIISSRSIDKLNVLKLEIEQSGGNCYLHPCDICSEDDVKLLISNIIERIGHIDIAILCSAVQYIDRVDKLDLAETEIMFQTNVIGIIRCTHYLISHMLKRKSGNIVFISSIMGEAAFPEMISYGATKAAISSFARGLQREVHSQGVHVTLALPGHMNTKLNIHSNERAPHWYGASGSLKTSKVAQSIIDAIDNKRSEIIIGLQSTMLSLMTRYAPPIANRIIKKITSY